MISGFWRRFGAFILDSIILGIFGFLLGGVFEDQFVEIGSWGRLFGFAIALSYFGIMNSQITKGQTLGKMILNIRVVNTDNKPIGILHSFARYSILGLPFFLNGMLFTNEITDSLWVYPISFIVFGMGFSIAYLYLFNRVTRQCLHDLAVGTYVVNINAARQEVSPIWKPHLAVVAVFLVIGTGAPVLTSALVQNVPFNEMLVTQTALVSNPSVNYATIVDGTTTFSSLKKGTKTTTYVRSQVFLKENTVKDEKLAKKLAEIIAANYPKSQRRNTIQIELTYGYDIGITEFWRSQTHSFDPGKLKNVGVVS